MGVSVGWTITLGEALTVLSVVGGALGMFFGVRADVRIVKHDLRSINDRVSNLADAFGTLGDILTKVAVQDTRIDRVEQDIRDLQRGEGMVIPLRKGAYEVGG